MTVSRDCGRGYHRLCFKTAWASGSPGPCSCWCHASSSTNQKTIVLRMTTDPPDTFIVIV